MTSCQRLLAFRAAPAWNKLTFTNLSEAATMPQEEAVDLQAVTESKQSHRGKTCHKSPAKIASLPNPSVLVGRAGSPLPAVGLWQRKQRRTPVVRRAEDCPPDALHGKSDGLTRAPGLHARERVTRRAAHRKRQRLVADCHPTPACRRPARQRLWQLWAIGR